MWRLTVLTILMFTSALFAAKVPAADLVEKLEAGFTESTVATGLYSSDQTASLAGVVHEEVRLASSLSEDKVNSIIASVPRLLQYVWGGVDMRNVSKEQFEARIPNFRRYLRNAFMVPSLSVAERERINAQLDEASAAVIGAVDREYASVPESLRQSIIERAQTRLRDGAFEFGDYLSPLERLYPGQSIIDPAAMTSDILASGRLTGSGSRYEGIKRTLAAIKNDAETTKAMYASYASAEASSINAAVRGRLDKWFVPPATEIVKKYQNPTREMLKIARTEIVPTTLPADKNADGNQRLLEGSGMKSGGGRIIPATSPN